MSSGFPDGDSPDEPGVFLVASAFLLVVTLIASALCLLLIFSLSRLASRNVSTSLFYGQLITGDLPFSLIGFFTQCLVLGNRKFLGGRGFCQFVAFGAHFSGSTAVVLFSIIALERKLKVVDRYSMSKPLAASLFGGATFLGFLTGAFPLFSEKLGLFRLHSANLMCYANLEFSADLLLMVLLIPASITISAACYYSIHKTLKNSAIAVNQLRAGKAGKHGKIAPKTSDIASPGQNNYKMGFGRNSFVSSPSSAGDTANPQVSQLERKTTFTMFLITVIFITGWTPVGIAFLCAIFNVDLVTGNPGMDLLICFGAYSVPCFNSIVYLTLNQQVNNEIRRTFPKLSFALAALTHWVNSLTGQDEEGESTGNERGSMTSKKNITATTDDQEQADIENQPPTSHSPPPPEVNAATIGAPAALYVAD